ncbi:hypothetical protein [Clostridium rectalis]|nr:hypothetical protein [Clostridium rectalis]
MNPVFYLIVFLISVIVFISLIPICNKLVDLARIISNKIFKDNEENE